MGLIPGSGRYPGEGNSNPLQYSCLENPMGRGAWRATVHGFTKVWHDLVTKHGKVVAERCKDRGFSASGGEEFNLGPETRLDRSELLCNKVLLKYNGDRESF